MPLGYNACHLSQYRNISSLPWSDLRQPRSKMTIQQLVKMFTLRFLIFGMVFHMFETEYRTIISNDLHVI